MGTEADVTDASTPPRSRWVWSVWVVALLALAAALRLTFLNGTDAGDPWYLPLASAITLGYTTVGAVLASRTPRNPIGWLMMVAGLAYVIGGLSGEYLAYAVGTQPASLHFGPLVGIVGNQLWMVMFAALVLLVLLFPTGEVPSPRWRFLPRAIVGVTVVASVVALLIPGPLTDLGLPKGVVIESPLGVETLRLVAPIVAGAGWILALGAAIPAIGALVMRYRRSTGEERQQIRWLAYVACTFLAVILLTATSSAIVGESFGDTVIGQYVFPLLAFAVAGIGIPVAVGIAVLRFRLYDLDLIVKKTAVFGFVVVLVLALGSILALVVGGSVVDRSTDAGSLIVGVILGLSVLPLYRLATRLADRLVYGGRASPYEVLTEFSQRVAETYSADDVLPRTAAVLGAGIGAETVRVWLRLGSQLRLVASWPSGIPTVEAPGLSVETIPPIAGGSSFEIRHQGELLGAISVRMPANDPMNPSKERLIGDLTSQEGLVLRNVRLIEELRESRRRIVVAQDERAKALERNIHDGAQQQLVALSVKLRLLEQMIERDPAKARTLAAELQAQAKDTLEDLRGLFSTRTTRGPLVSP